MVDQSLLIRILPGLELRPLHDAVNHDLTIFGHENRTVRETTVAAYLCPTDPDAGPARPGGLPLVLVSLGLAHPDRPYLVARSSYAGMSGARMVDAIPRPENGCRAHPAALAQLDGTFHDGAPIRASSFDDGLGNTVVAAERVLLPLRDIEDDEGTGAERFGWAVSGNWGDSLVTALFAPNLHRKLPGLRSAAHARAASSLHPGGLNALSGDGSVRFLSERVSSWPSDPADGYPLGARLDTTGAWGHLPAPSVWQALATRSGGEAVPLDAP
jgi:hypothetical protein